MCLAQGNSISIAGRYALAVPFRMAAMHPVRIHGIGSPESI